MKNAHTLLALTTVLFSACHDDDIQVAFVDVKVWPNQGTAWKPAQLRWRFEVLAWSYFFDLATLHKGVADEKGELSDSTSHVVGELGAKYGTFLCFVRSGEERELVCYDPTQPDRDGAVWPLGDDEKQVMLTLRACASSIDSEDLQVVHRDCDDRQVTLSLP